MKFGNDNPLLPNDMKKGQSYITKDNQVVKFVKRETDLDSWDTKYYFSLSGRGNYVMTHDEVLDNVTYLNEMLMRKKTELKLRKLIERIIREESGIVGDMDKSFFKTQKKIGTAKMKKDFLFKMGGDTFGKTAGKVVDIFGIDYDNNEAMTDLGLLSLDYLTGIEIK